MHAPATPSPAWARNLRSRPFRVVVLITLIAAMSAIDLYLTLLYLTHVGMPEANPLARAFISYQSPLILAAWKCLTVTVCAGILFLARHRGSAEAGAWVGAAVLCGLMTHWVRFIDHSARQSVEFVIVGASINDDWVRIGVDPAVP